MLFIPLHDSNPLKIIKFQAVTFALIGICIAVYGMQFMLELSAGQDSAFAFAQAWGVIPKEILQGQSPAFPQAPIPESMTLLSTLFLHGSFMHLAGNMLYLWVFGDNVEDAMGHFRFLVFYLLCGVAATMAHVMMADGQGALIPLIGASGAISGILGAYLMLHPKVKVLILIMWRVPWRFPARWVLLSWIVFQFVGLFAGDVQTAWYAHLGGFLAGVILVPLFKSSKVPLFDRGRYDDFD
ncbi:MAG: rhomboid family intramembrane serine protease [Alphaproteobacteria bacterium]